MEEDVYDDKYDNGYADDYPCRERKRSCYARVERGLYQPKILYPVEIIEKIFRDEIDG